MKLAELVAEIGGLPLFESSLLLAGDRDGAEVRRQLSRWARDGKVLQLRRGLYMLAAPYRKEDPHPFLVANRIVAPSYVSHLSALSFWDMVPEGVPVTTSVTTARPQRRDTPAGRHLYRHVSTGRWFGFSQIEVQRGQLALIAQPEKALLDLIHLTPGADDENYLRELRLQNMEGLNGQSLESWAKAMGGRKLERAVKTILDLRDEEMREFRGRGQ